MPTTLEPILARHPFFQGLEPQYLQLMVGCAANVMFQQGQVIFRADDEVDRFYLIRRGHVAIELYAPPRGTITIQTLHEGDILGWSWLIPPYRPRFSARRSSRRLRLAWMADVCARSAKPTTSWAMSFSRGSRRFSSIGWKQRASSSWIYTPCGARRATLVR